MMEVSLIKEDLQYLMLLTWTQGGLTLSLVHLDQVKDVAQSLCAVQTIISHRS